MKQDLSLLCVVVLRAVNFLIEVVSVFRSQVEIGLEFLYEGQSWCLQENTIVGQRLSSEGSELVLVVSPVIPRSVVPIGILLIRHRVLHRL